MKIKFEFNERTQIIGLLNKVVPPYSIIGEIASIGFLSKNLYYFASLYEQAYKGFKKVAQDILNGKFDDIFDKIESYGFEECKKFVNNIIRDLKKYYENHINNAMLETKNIFLFKLFPKRVRVLLFYNFSPNMSEGSLIKADTNEVIVLQSINRFQSKKSEDNFLIFLHELFHGLFVINLSSNLIKEILKEFEECLLDFFVPKEWLGYKLCILSKEKVMKNFENIFKIQSPRYRWYENYLKRLQILRDYDFSKDVWNWLLENTKDKELKTSLKCSKHAKNLNLFKFLVATNDMKVYIFKDGIFFGKNKLNLYEGLYLLKNKKIKVVDINKKDLSFEEIYSKLNDDLRAYYKVYEYLKEKNIKFGAGMKFGGPFRVYEDPNDEHSKWICIPSRKCSKFLIYDFIAKNRTAHSTRKTLLVAIEDNGKIEVLEIKWRRL